MATLLALVPRHERRVRLVFDTALAAGAFAAVTFYAITNEDGLGAHPAVIGAIAVPNTPAAVDLVVDSDLVDGALYNVAVTAVPAVDLSTATGTLPIRLGQHVAAQDLEVSPGDVDALLYGQDCIWSGTDYVETPQGDLAVHAGPDVVRADIRAGCLSEGLQWDPEWGAKPRQHVDAVAASVPAYKAEVLRQIYRDDRVRIARVTTVIDDAVGEALFDVAVDLIGLGDTVRDTFPIRAI